MTVTPLTHILWNYRLFFFAVKSNLSWRKMLACQVLTAFFFYIPHTVSCSFCDSRVRYKPSVRPTHPATWMRAKPPTPISLLKELMCGKFCTEPSKKTWNRSRPWVSGEKSENKPIHPIKSTLMHCYSWASTRFLFMGQCNGALSKIQRRAVSCNRVRREQQICHRGTYPVI